MDNNDTIDDAGSLDDFEELLGTTGFEYFDTDNEEPKELDFGE